MDIIYFILSLFGIFIGANITIDQAIIIARKLNLSKLFIGLTILSIGTSLPEIFTHIFSSISEINGISATNVAIGTNIGSNIFQITFIVGIVSYFSKIKINKNILSRDFIFMLFSIALLIVLGLNGVISRLEGLILLLLYLFYLNKLYDVEESSRKIKTSNSKNIFIHIFYLIIGLMFLSLSADNIVSYAVYLSKSIGIEQSFIGVLIIGIATGLPELTTAIEGIRKKSKDMSLGVLIGSNITNPLMGVGIGALIIDNPISKTIVNIDLVSWFLISFALYLLIYNKKVIPKKTGIIMVCLYFAFIIYKINFII